MLSLGTLFTCAGGFESGAVAAGYTPVFGLEIDPKPAEVYRQNFGDHLVLADVRDYDFAGIKSDHLHASPSCKTSSTANKDRGETQFDVDCALAVCRAIAQISPDTFSLENVVAYKTMKPLDGKTNAFGKILEQLYRLGYKYEYRTLNAADYGVPQTRKRLILIATKQGYPVFPAPTHSKPTQQKSLFELPDWVTWYEAIADLIPTLKETDLAPWQQKAVSESTLFSGRTKGSGFLEVLTSPIDRPSFVIDASVHKGMPKIALIEKVGARSDRPLRQISNKFPVPTLKALGQDGHWEQWVIKNGVQILQTDIRCLARWQSFPEWYQFPTSKPVACSLIGNSVAPLLAQRIMEAIKSSRSIHKELCLSY